MPCTNRDGTDYLDYVRRHYGVEVKIGQRVRVDGELGTVIHNPTFANHYVHVRLDRGMDAPCHPTWRMTYLPESEEISDA
jgi:hypothetical protein